ncbi:MAG: siroheme synthase CysG [Rhodospirillales bacterium]|nr:siroheme synthase CysG [Rhodospirillales bacterium]
MDYLPVFMDVKGGDVLVVGGGESAARKIRLIRKAGGRVEVIAPHVDQEIRDLWEAGRVGWTQRRFEMADVEDRTIVYAATGIAGVDETVSAAARNAGVHINAVDRPDLCSFITPSIIDRGQIVVGISTGGSAPVLARDIRSRIEALLPANLGKLASFAASFRDAAKANIPDETGRRRFWERFFRGPIAETVLRGDERTARERMVAAVNRPRGRDAEAGLVSIVGAGPGDPDLLTFKAMRALQNADVVLYDRLVAPEILDYARRDADRVNVGKGKGRPSASQDQIHALMIKHARAGQRVVRLKAGDPFVFGRGGEELEVLRSHGIDTEVVPGVTAAMGCAGATGIPLTHRDVTSAVTFVTGHGQSGGTAPDWSALAKSAHTLVIYMGVSTAAEIAGNLIAHGLAPSTPVAVIENGTRANQKTVRGDLAGLAELITDSGIKGPAIIIVGEVTARQRSSLPEMPAAVAV